MCVCENRKRPHASEQSQDHCITEPLKWTGVLKKKKTTKKNVFPQQCSVLNLPELPWQTSSRCLELYTCTFLKSWLSTIVLYFGLPKSMCIVPEPQSAPLLLEYLKYPQTVTMSWQIAFQRVQCELILRNMHFVGSLCCVFTCTQWASSLTRI